MLTLPYFVCLDFPILTLHAEDSSPVASTSAEELVHEIITSAAIATRHITTFIHFWRVDMKQSAGLGNQQLSNKFIQ